MVADLMRDMTGQRLVDLWLGVEDERFVVEEIAQNDLDDMVTIFGNPFVGDPIWVWLYAGNDTLFD